MFPPRRCFEPYYPAAVTTRRDEIDSAVLVRVARMDVGGAFLILRDDVLFPRLRRIGRGFPPCKIIADRRRFAFGAGGDVRFPITIDVPESHVMSQTWSIFIGEHGGFPGSAGSGLCRNRQPDDRLRKWRIDWLGAVGDQIHPVIAI